MEQLETIVANRIEENEIINQSQLIILFVTIGNDGLRSNDKGTQIMAEVNGEANQQINITKISVKTALTQVKDHINSEETAVGRNQRQQPMKMETQLLDQGQVTGKIEVLRQRLQLINEYDTRSKTNLQIPLANIPLRSFKARANSGSPNHFTIEQELRKKADIAPDSEDLTNKFSKDNKTNVGSKYQKKDRIFHRIRQKQYLIPRLTCKEQLCRLREVERRKEELQF
ncbi:MAG: hypothetical protein EZS28_018008 [Streblomastix strix]|uniref:Uncharacterized protein n=1 Tax=Streblomastix strix TaxID=222440 RepID=A0A5J4VVA8_9EUKA|nr:MAG: hypothetical protein EZS28_018008 [Streblomastix strix]